MKKIIKQITATVFASSFFIFTGCGSGGGSSTNPATSITGIFLDDLVEGLNYSCSSGNSGITNANGEYTCNAGDNVTFNIADLTLGTIAAQTAPITPYSLFPNDINKAVDLARLLQTLNTKSTSGVIELNSTLTSTLTFANIGLGTPSFQSSAETLLQPLTLVSAGDAQYIMNSAITTAGSAIPTNSNNIPIANAGVDQNVTITSTITLDASNSSDYNQDSLTYMWSLISKPSESNASLSSTTDVHPTFFTDVAGEYIFSLTVNDGNADSSSDTVVVIASNILHNGVSYGTVISPFTGKIWLDRNLGANQICTDLNDTMCYGDYYQWGRNYDGHQIFTSETNSTQITNINNSSTYFIVDVRNTDWTSQDSNGTQRVVNWNSIDGSSICPAGYRVPTKAELTNETTTVNTPMTNNTDAFNSFLKLPSAGYRNYINGLMYNQGSEGSLWSQSITSTYSYDLRFKSSSVSTNFNFRSNGLPIRCVKD